MTRGLWCLHCERVWVRDRVDERKGCPAPDCDGHSYDLWRVSGDFEHGEAIGLYGDPKFETLIRE